MQTGINPTKNGLLRHNHSTATVTPPITIVSGALTIDNPNAFFNEFIAFSSNIALIEKYQLESPKQKATIKAYIPIYMPLLPEFDFMAINKSAKKTI